MLRQLDLFGSREIAFDAVFAGLRRRELAFAGWVDHQPRIALMFRPAW